MTAMVTRTQFRHDLDEKQLCDMDNTVLTLPLIQGNLDSTNLRQDPGDLESESDFGGLDSARLLQSN